MTPLARLTSHNTGGGDLLQGAARSPANRGVPLRFRASRFRERLPNDEHPMTLPTPHQTASPDRSRVRRPRPKGPRGIPFLGNAVALKADPLRFLTRISREYGDVVASPCPGNRGTDPAHRKQGSASRLMKEITKWRVEHRAGTTVATLWNSAS